MCRAMGPLCWNKRGGRPAVWSDALIGCGKKQETAFPRAAGKDCIARFSGVFRTEESPGLRSGDPGIIRSGGNLTGKGFVYQPYPQTKTRAERLLVFKTSGEGVRAVQIVEAIDIPGREHALQLLNQFMPFFNGGAVFGILRRRQIGGRKFCRCTGR